MRYFLADATGKELRYSVHLNRIHRWYDALLTPTKVEAIWKKSGSDAEIERLIKSIYGPLNYVFKTSQPGDKDKPNNDKSVTSGNSALRTGSGMMNNNNLDNGKSSKKPEFMNGF